MKLAGLVSIVSAVIFDIAVVVLTIYRTGRLAVQSRKVKISGSLSLILLRDGAYFYAVSCNTLEEFLMTLILRDVVLQVFRDEFVAISFMLM